MDGAVVRPTTPNGFQYRLWVGASFDPGATNTLLSASPEPEWPETIEWDVWFDGDANGKWVASDPIAGIDETIPAGMIFYPSEVGFVCFNHSGVTGQPFVSIGTAAAPALLVNNQQLTAISGANQVHRFTSMPANGITDLRITLVTAATGTSPRFHGRFYAKGFFIQTQG
jgi:hypothetical protein